MERNQEMCAAGHDSLNSFEEDKISKILRIKLPFCVPVHLQDFVRYQQN